MDCSTSARDDRFLGYPLNRLVAVFDNGTDAQATLDDLVASGFAGSFDTYCGTGGARLIDFSGEDHGRLAQLSRALHHLNAAEAAHMDRYEQELEAGHCLVMVETHDADRQSRALEILKSHGGHFINHYGRWFIEQVQP
jgi:hypothetical protein